MLEEIINTQRTNIDNAIAALRRNLLSVRTSQLTVSILDGILVNYYNRPTPIAQMATVSLMDSTTLSIKPFEKSQVPAIEKAVREGLVGTNLVVNADTIRIVFPVMTSQRKTEAVALARKYGDDCKVAIRTISKEAYDKSVQLAGTTETTTQIQNAETTAITQADSLVLTREKEING